MKVLSASRRYPTKPNKSTRATFSPLRIAVLTTCLWHGQNVDATEPTEDTDRNLQNQQIETNVSSIAEQTPIEFLNVLEQAAKAGSAEAALALGNRYFHGTDVVKNLPSALQWWTQAASLGSAEAAYNLGVAHINGFGTVKDTEKAELAFVQAAKQQFPKALLALGILNLQAAQSDEQIFRAGEYFRRAAERGNVIARKNLALMYEKGIGYEPDAKRAEYWRSYQTAKPKKDISPDLTRAVKSTEWVLNRDPEHYTLQVVSGDTFADTEKLISAVESLDCAIFNKILGEQTRFVAIAGDFETYTNATQALSELPQKLRKNRPFIVKFSVLQRQINEHTNFNN